MQKPSRYTARVIAKEKISNKVYAVKLEIVDGKTLTFAPGQTVMFLIAPGVNRSMSIASPPSENHTFLMFHDVAPGGPFSRWTLSATVGTTIDFLAPLGVFYLDQTSNRNKVYVATGTGIAPFRSMLFHQFPGAKESIDLYWGLRHEEDIFWKEDMEKLSATHPNFHFSLVLSQPSDSWQGMKGHVTEYMMTLSEPASREYYLCGNKFMVREVSGKLHAAGVPDGQVKYELFY